MEILQPRHRMTRRGFLRMVTGAGVAWMLPRRTFTTAAPSSPTTRYQFSQKRTWIELYGSLGETITVYDRLYRQRAFDQAEKTQDQPVEAPSDEQALLALAAQGYNRIHLLTSRRTNNVRYFDQLLPQAHRAGLRMNAWFFPFDGVDFKPLINAHPEWEFRTREGSRKWVSLEVDTDFKVALFGSYEHRLCPYHPETRRLVLEYYADYLRRHRPNGFHLDWELQPCYNAYCRLAFKRQFGLDPVGIKPFHPDFMQWRIAQNMDFLRRVARLVRAIRPAAEFSLAVPMPDESGFSLFDTGVDYRAAGTLVDVLEPLVYLNSTEDLARIRRAITATKHFVPSKVVISPAIILRGKKKGEIKTPERVADEIRAVAEATPQGISLWEVRYAFSRNLRDLITEIPNTSRTKKKG